MIKSLFKIVVVMSLVTIQSVFRLEMYQNKVFYYFLKIIFDINISK